VEQKARVYGVSREMKEWCLEGKNRKKKGSGREKEIKMTHPSRLPSKLRASGARGRRERRDSQR